MAASVLVIMLAPAALSDPAWGLDIIDPGAFHPNPAERPITALGSSDRSLNVKSDTLKGADEHLFADQRDSTDQDRKDLDWCMWSALASMAGEVANGQTNIDGTLEASVETCLTNHLSGTAEASSISWVAKAMTLRDNLQMLESLGDTAQQAWDYLATGGTIELPANEWERWFNEDAASVPPV